MKRYSTIFLLTLVFTINILALDYSNFRNFADISNPYSPESNYSNPATISWLDSPRLSGGYEMLYLGMNHDNLSSGIINFSYPMKTLGTVGFRTSFFNANHFAQNSFVIQYSYKLDQMISVGMGIGLITRGYNTDDVEGFDLSDEVVQDASKGSFTLGLGGTYMIFDDTFLGFKIDNIFKPDLGLEDESKEPLSLTLGVSSRIGIIQPYFDFSYYSDNTSNFLVGAEGWFMNEMLGTKINFTNNNVIFGIGLQYSNYRLDYDYILANSGVKEVSSGSHQMLLTYNFKTAK